MNNLMQQTNNYVSYWFFWLLLVLTPVESIAKEPPNLAIAKQELRNYYRTGQYLRDVDTVITQALIYLKTTYLKAHPRIKKPAIVLDIDETVLSNFKSMDKLNFGGTLAEIQRAENLGNDPALKPTYKLYKFATKHHISIFFISARPENERASTIRNLRKVGYRQWNGLIMKPLQLKHTSAALYKTDMRHQLIMKGYKILVNVGDQKSDLGRYALKSFKLPNPFYFIP